LHRKLNSIPNFNKKITDDLYQMFRKRHVKTHTHKIVKQSNPHKEIISKIVIFCFVMSYIENLKLDN